MSKAILAAGWLVLSVPLGILVGKALKVNREHQELQDRQELQERLAQRAHREASGPRVLRGLPAHPVPKAHRVNRAR